MQSSATTAQEEASREEQLEDVAGALVDVDDVAVLEEVASGEDFFAREPLRQETSFFVFGDTVVVAPGGDNFEGC